MAAFKFKYLWSAFAWMELRLVVHGVVQGVGYRYFVKNAALRHGIGGSVRNVSDGSVEIVAAGTPEALKLFEQDITVDTEHGPSVMRVEKTVLNADEGAHPGFEIGQDKQL